jgi:class 3 adenylate cyclase/tetratricopeptide (TPR) repeat protein
MRDRWQLFRLADETMTPIDQPLPPGGRYSCRSGPGEGATITTVTGRFEDARHYLPRLLLSHDRDAFASGYLELDGTLMSADLSGFTNLSERLARLGREGAEVLTEVLNNCFDRMIGVVTRDGGDILKFGGDALLMLYTGPQHTARACRSALAMRALIAEPVVAPSGARVKLRISQGIHSGTFGLFVATGGHAELIVTGPGTTETVRCEGEAAAGEILLSASAAASVSPAWLGPEKAGGRLLRRIAVSDDVVVDLGGEELASTADHAWLEQFIPGAQREQIAAETPSEHRGVTVAFVTFSGTDTLYETEGPGAIAQLLANLGGVVGTATKSHGVHWLASDVYPDGGKLILAAGAPISYGRDEDRMLRAVREILDAGFDLDLRAGVNYGPVFAGNLGSQERRTFTVMGDAVNLAARLMQKAGSDQLIVSTSLADRVRGRFVSEPLEPFLVKGKAQPVRASVVSAIESVETVSVPSHLPLVGRDEELEQLRGAVEDARGGRGRVVEIVGDSGTGKSRLVEELRATESNVRTVTAICGQYAQSTPYFALRVLLRGLAGLDALAAPDVAAVALSRWVGEVAPELARWLPLLAVPFNADVASTPDADRISPEFRRARTRAAMAELLDAACRSATVFIVEDAEYLDDASREVLADLAADPGARPWLLVLTRHPRSEALDAPESPSHSVIELEALDEHRALELAVLAAGNESKLLPSEWAAVTDRAGGNPLFVIELASRAASEGSVSGLPESVESLVTTRIDTLAAEDRKLLREAAVLGMVIDLEVFATELATPAVRDVRRWSSLSEFVEDFAPGRLRFRHRLHQQVAYEGLSYRRRRDAHRRVGDALAERTDGHPERDAELLSTHYFYARAHELAWDYSVIAGDRAHEKYAMVEAAEFYGRALESAPRIEGLRTLDVARVAEALGDVCELSGRYEEAASSYARSRKLIGDARDDSVRLLRKEGTVRERTGRYRDALRWYSRALRMIDAADDIAAASARAELSLRYAAVRHRQGRFNECIAWAERALGDAQRSNDQASLARSYFVLDMAHTYLGHAERFEYRGRALPIYEALADDVGQSIALNNLGLVAYHECEWEDALSYYRRSRDACDRTGDVVGWATAVNNEGEILLDQGHVGDARALLRSALRVWRSARYPMGVGVAAANLGLAEVRSGNVEAGLSLLKEATALITDLGGEFRPRIYAQQLAACLYAGRFDDALERAPKLRQSLDTEKPDELTIMWTERALGWLLVRVGRLDEAAGFIDDGIARAEAVNARYEVGLFRHIRAELLRAKGQVHEAAAEEMRAWDVLRSVGVVQLPAVPEAPA